LDASAARLSLRRARELLTPLKSSATAEPTIHLLDFTIASEFAAWRERPDAGELRAAERALERLDREAERLIDLFPTDRLALQAAAEHYTRKARVYWLAANSGRERVTDALEGVPSAADGLASMYRQKAVSAGERAIGLLEKSAAGPMLTAEDQQQFGVHHQNLGDFQLSVGNRTSAGKSYARATELLETASRAQPDNVDFSFSLATARKQFGAFLVATGDERRGGEQCSDALAILSQLAERFPSHRLFEPMRQEAAACTLGPH
jgi:tetratricopeptide (TPR) repeat protein